MVATSLSRDIAGIHAPLETWVKQAPGRTFLLAEQQVTFEQVRNWIDHLGPRLCSAKRVALWLPKSNAMAMSILASLYAGAAYIPLDSRQPWSRVARILADAQPEVIVIDAGYYLQHQESLQQLAVQILVMGDSTEERPQHASACWLQPTLLIQPAAVRFSPQSVTADNIAAILYTSGSTGVPKGVQLSQRNLLNFIHWAQDSLHLTSADRILNTANFNFDLSTFDLFAALEAGAAVWISSEAEQNNLPVLLDIMQQQGITVLYAVPSLLRLLTRAGAWCSPAGEQLRYLLFAGEAMPRSLLLQLLEQTGPACQLFNWYGPTETNVCLSYQVCVTELAGRSSVPIGRPVHGVQAWIRDEQGTIINEYHRIGELVVSGDCVTPGYVGAGRGKVALMHAAGQHATGDLVSFDGRYYSYHGRIDRMVKIRGYRVELGEVEAVLAQHPSVCEAAIAFNAEQQRLVAFVSCQDPSAMTEMELRSYCASCLPGYMIPQRFCLRQTLPKNANGKTDYCALAELQVSV